MTAPGKTPVPRPPVPRASKDEPTSDGGRVGRSVTGCMQDLMNGCFSLSLIMALAGAAVAVAAHGARLRRS